MADIIQKVKYADLPKTTVVKDNDMILLSDGTTSRTITADNLKTEILKDVQVDTSELATKEELTTGLNSKANVGHTHSEYATTTQLNTKADASHNHDSVYATKSSEHTHSNKTELDKIQTGDKAKWDLKDIYPSNLSSIVVNPLGGLTEGMNISGLSLGKIIELAFCTDSPAMMYYGWIPLSVHNNCGYENITMNMLKDSRSSITELSPQTLGKTSLGLTPDEGYCIVAIPSSSSLTAQKDNGLGAKVPFYTVDCGAVGTVVSLDGKNYKLYGEIVWAEGQMFAYVD